MWPDWRRFYHVRGIVGFLADLVVVISDLYVARNIIRDGLEASVPAWLLLLAALFAFVAGRILGKSEARSSPSLATASSLSPLPAQVAKTKPTAEVLSDAMKRITHDENENARVTIKEEVAVKDARAWVKHVSQLVEDF